MQLSPRSIDSACAAVFHSWLRFVPEGEARTQAEGFRRRCATLAAENHLTEAELDATLSSVAKAME